MKIFFVQQITFRIEIVKRKSSKSQKLFYEYAF